MGNSQNARPIISIRSTNNQQLSLLPDNIGDEAILNEIYLRLEEKIRHISNTWDSEVTIRPKQKLLWITILPEMTATTENYMSSVLLVLNERAKQQKTNRFVEWFLNKELRILKTKNCTHIINFTQTVVCNGMFTHCKTTVSVSGETCSDVDSCFKRIADNIKQGKCGTLEVVYSQMVAELDGNNRNLHRVAFIIEQQSSVEIIITVYFGGSDWNVGLDHNVEIFRKSLESLLGPTVNITMRSQGGIELCNLGIQSFLRGDGKNTLDQGFCQVYSMLWLYFAIRVAAAATIPQGALHRVMDNFDSFFVSKFKGAPHELYSFTLKFALFYVAQYIRKVVPDEFPEVNRTMISLVGNKKRKL